MRFAAVALSFAVAACAREAATETSAADAQKSAAAAEITSVGDTPAEDPWPEKFPMPAADYSGVYEFASAGATMEVAVAASGARQRITFPPGSGIGGARGQWSQAMVNENAGATMLMWPEGENAPPIATKMSRSDLGAMASAFGVGAEKEANAQRTGTDNIAGESCAVWEFGAKEGDPAGSACVTRDGIPLRVISGGQTVMLAKAITRGTQDALLFAPPAGYEVVDMGECMRMSAEMMEAMRAGKTPDIAKMEKCRILSEKMGAMYGE